MKVWKRAAGALKDSTSICLASLSSARHPPLHTFIIKATSHDEDTIDYKNARRLLAWVRSSPANLHPLHLALANRIGNTRSWAVALKGLILMHGFLCSNVPAVHLSARLPFDLSTFRSSDHRKYWAYDSFIISYFAFLDQRSSVACLNYYRDQCAKPRQEDTPMEQELKKLVMLQSLLDKVLEVKPREVGMCVHLILEAMDCVVIEIYEIYSRICKGVASVLLRIYTATDEEAALALKVIQKAVEQGDHLTHYFDYCCRIGVLSVLDCPMIQKIPHEDIRVIERMIKDGTYRKTVSRLQWRYDEETIVAKEVISNRNEGEKDEALRTIITEKWEVFEDPIQDANTLPFQDDLNQKNKEKEDPFADFSESKPRRTPNYTMPDLITF